MTAELPHKAPPRGRLQRNTRRRWLGGVCAGLADYLGIEAGWLRFALLLSVFFSFSLTFWIYVILWVLLPAKPEVPIPDVSWQRRRELRRIDGLVRRAHRRLPATVANQAQGVLDAMKIMAGELESASGSTREAQSAWSQVSTQLPPLLGRMLADSREDEQGYEEMRAMEKKLRTTSRAAFAEQLAGQNLDESAPSGRFAAWREKIAPLQTALAPRIGPQTLAVLEAIEHKLAFLLSRADTGDGLFDLARFDLERIAFEYLPQALENYLKLPADMARSHRISGGVTAEEALTEQLIRLDQALEDLASSLFERDAQGLLIHGRFLRERFGEQPLESADRD